MQDITSPYLKVKYLELRSILIQFSMGFIDIVRFSTRKLVESKRLLNFLVIFSEKFTNKKDTN